MRLFSTLQRQLVELPPPPARVGIYVCGPTVYQRIHVGNARPRWGRIWTPRRILVGVDRSSHSLVALKTADDLAARLGSVVTVLAATAGKRIETEGVWAKRVEEWVPDRPVTALLDRSTGADLIVVGSRGLHGLRSLGSVSERVAHNALCSVLVVRPLEQLSERAS